MTPKAIKIVTEIPQVTLRPQPIAALDLFEIRMALRDRVRAHHRDFAPDHAALMRAVCACGNPTGGPAATEACRKLAKADQDIIGLEGAIGAAELRAESPKVELSPDEE